MKDSDVLVLDEPKLSLGDQFYMPQVLFGLGTTMKHMFRVLGGRWMFRIWLRLGRGERAGLRGSRLRRSGGTASGAPRALRPDLARESEHRDEHEDHERQQLQPARSASLRIRHRRGRVLGAPCGRSGFLRCRRLVA